MSLFEVYGTQDYIGEPMSITEHSLQTAQAAAKGGEGTASVGMLLPEHCAASGASSSRCYHILNRIGHLTLQRIALRQPCMREA